jgi:hypothetical protein
MKVLFSIFQNNNSWLVLFMFLILSFAFPCNADTTFDEGITSIKQVQQTCCLNIMTQTFIENYQLLRDFEGEITSVDLSGYLDAKKINIADLCVPVGEIRYTLKVQYYPQWDVEEINSVEITTQQTDFDCDSQTRDICPPPGQNTIPPGGDDAGDSGDNDDAKSQAGDDGSEKKSCGGCETVSADPSAPLASGMALVGLLLQLAARARRK